MTCNGIWQNQVFLIKKDIPLFKLLLNIASFLCRNRQRIELENISNKTLIMDLNSIIKKLTLSFEKIDSLCDDLFCTGYMIYIVNNDQCIKTFEQFINNEPFDFFDLGEINEIMDLIHMELMTFKKVLEKLIMVCQFFKVGSKIFFKKKFVSNKILKFQKKFSC